MFGTLEEIKARLLDAAKEDKFLRVREIPFLAQLKLFVGGEQDCGCCAVNLKANRRERWVLEDDHERPRWIPDPNGTGNLCDRGGDGDPGVKVVKVRAGKLVTEILEGPFTLKDRLTGEVAWSSE